MTWSKVNLKRFKDKTLPEIVWHDPDYFFWGIANNVFKGPLSREATEIDYKARNIKIPQEEGRDKMVAQYNIHRPTGKFGDMEIVEESEYQYKHSIRRDTIDLSVPREIYPKDKFGNKMMIKQVQKILFKKDIQLTKAFCEEFFDNNDNFV